MEEKHQSMIENDVWCQIKLSKVPKGSNILTSTWVYKLKSNGTKRDRSNGRGHEQVNRVCYDQASIYTPVINENSVQIQAPMTNENSVQLVIVLTLMARQIERINNVKRVFLKNNLDQQSECIYMRVL
eukprot:6634275-Ditylum_brightwellii.AAC.1